MTTRLRFLLSVLLAVACASPARAGDPEFVQVSPGVWMVTVKSSAGIFSSAATTKRMAIEAANEFAAKRDMEAVPMSLETHRGGPGYGGFPSADYQFRLVPKGSGETVGLKPRADLEIEVNNNTPPAAPVVVQNQVQAPTPDLYAELLKLDDLRKRGLLTDAEFDAQKAKLLAH